MPTDFGSLAGYIGIPGALMAVALGVMYRAYQKALVDKDAINRKALDDRDDRIEKLEARVSQLEARLYRVLDRGEQLADLVDAPVPAPAVRRRRSEV